MLQSMMSSAVIPVVSILSLEHVLVQIKCVMVFLYLQSLLLVSVIYVVHPSKLGHNSIYSCIIQFG